MGKLMKTIFTLLVIVCCFCQVGHANKEKNEDKKPTTDRKKADHTKDKKQPSVHKKLDNNPQDEDFETNQGFPILFPETHMSMKRNTSAVESASTNKPTGKNNNSTETSSNSTSSSASDSSEETITTESMGKTPKVNGTNATSAEEGKCHKDVDLLFLIDSSESVRYTNWKIIIGFVKDLCNRFSLNTTRVAFIRFASEPEIAVPLTQFNSTEARDEAIDNIFYKTGGTRTDIALKKAMEVFPTGEPRNQVIMLLTDGPTNRLEISKDRFVEGKDLVAAPAERLKEAGIALFCIGIEPDSETPQEIDTMREEMMTIASEPTKQHVFMSDGYHELQRKVHSVSQAACVVNGAWSRWSEFSPCSVTCSYGTRVRMRTCTEPVPANNGADCTGPRVEDEECYMGPCKVSQSAGPVTTPQPRRTPFVSFPTAPSMAASINSTLFLIPDAPFNNNNNTPRNNATATTVSFTNTTNLQSIPHNSTGTAAAAAGSGSIKLTNASSLIQQQQQQQQQPSLSTAASAHDTKQPIEFPIADSKPQTNKSASSLLKTPSQSMVNSTTALTNDKTNNSASVTATTNDLDVKPNNNTTEAAVATGDVSVAGKTNSANVEADKTTATLPVLTVEKVIHPSLRNASPSKNETSSSGIQHSLVEGSSCELKEILLNDTQFIASSIYSHDTDDDYVKREYAPPNARLNNEINGGSWCAEHKYSTQDDKDQFIQVDLGKQMSIDGVATQGSHLLENWVKKYNLRYSDDGRSWQYYSKNPLAGNIDQNTVQRNTINPPITGRFIQLNPIEWNQENESDKHDICMRIALFKCRESGSAAVPAEIHIKRSFIQPRQNNIYRNKHRNSGKRGVVIKEHASWSHFPEDKEAKLTLVNVNRFIGPPSPPTNEDEARNRRQDEDISSSSLSVNAHKKGNKRIFFKIRKIAHNIVKKLRAKNKKKT